MILVQSNPPVFIQSRNTNLHLHWGYIIMLFWSKKRWITEQTWPVRSRPFLSCYQQGERGKIDFLIEFLEAHIKEDTKVYVIVFKYSMFSGIVYSSELSPSQGPSIYYTQCVVKVISDMGRRRLYPAVTLNVARFRTHTISCLLQDKNLGWQGASNR
jgi:hypothetical protein